MTVVDARDGALGRPSGDDAVVVACLLRAGVLGRGAHTAGEERDLVGANFRSTERRVDGLVGAEGVHFDLLQHHECVAGQIGEVGANLLLNGGCRLKEIGVGASDRRDFARGREDLCRSKHDDDQHTHGDQELGEGEGESARKSEDASARHQSSSTVA